MNLIDKDLDPSGQTERIVRIGLIFTGLFVAGFLLWASQVQIGGAIIADGEVQTDSDAENIRSPAVGFIQEVFVEEGQHVESGQDLLSFAWSAPKAERDRLWCDWARLNARIERLESELKLAPSMKMPNGYSDQGASAEQIWETESRLFEAKRLKFINSKDRTDSALGPGEQKQKTARLLLEYQTEALEHMTSLEKEREKLHQRLLSVSEKKSTEVIHAPSSGTISLTRHLVKGSLLELGSPIMKVRPDQPETFFVAYVRNRDIRSVFLGQSAEIQWSTSQHKRLRLEGRVVSIPPSPDTEISQSNQAVYYKVAVRINPTPMADNQNRFFAIRTPATILLRTQGRTFLDMLFRPLEDTLIRGLRQD